MNCPICSSKAGRVLTTVTTPYGDRRERYAINICAHCRHGHASGRHDAAFLTQIYEGDFHRSSQQAILDEASPVNVNAHERVNWLRSRRSGGALLDVGCGNGAFVAAARHSFNASGVELSAPAVRTCRDRELNVQQGNFLELGFSDQRFDVLTFWDVLAGFSNVVAVLQKSAAILSPSGSVIASVPMIDSLAARVLKSYWPLMIPPVNLHYFSHSSIAALAQASGFEVVEIQTMAKRVALDFLAMKAARSMRLFSLAEWLGKTIPSKPVTINTHDIAYVVLRRKNDLQ